jgi:hypothetical protein
MGRYAPAFFSERCLIGLTKRDRSDMPRNWEEHQKGELESGKAPPTLRVERCREMTLIEEDGEIVDIHIKLDKSQ